MAEVLCVYREVKLIKETAAAAKQKPSDAVAIVSYDEKPGIQAIATTAPDLPPEPGRHATFARDHEYKRHGTVSLLAGIDLAHRQIHALVKAATAAANSLNSSSSSTSPIEPYRDQADPRQSFGAHLQGDQGLARRAACRPLRIHLHVTAAIRPQVPGRVQTWLCFQSKVCIRSTRACQSIPP